jgi:hypothetical protein
MFPVFADFLSLCPGGGGLALSFIFRLTYEPCFWLIYSRISFTVFVEQREKQDFKEVFKVSLADKR